MKKVLSIKRLKLSFKYAIKGVITTYKTEPNMKIHLSVALLVIIFGIIFKLSLYEWITIIFLIGTVLAAETLNTSIENYVDLVCKEKNEKAANTKDAAAGFVLLLAITSAIIGLIIFIPKIINTIS